MLKTILRPFIAPIAWRKLAGLEAKQAALQAAIDLARVTRRVTRLYAEAKANTMERLRLGEMIKK